MCSKRIHVQLSPQLLEAVERAAGFNLMTRSAFIRQSIVMRLNDQHLAPNPRIEDTLELLRQAGKQQEV